MATGIIDAQVHMGPGGIPETLKAMDALGIQAILVDEYWLADAFAYDPHEKLPDGGIRPIAPTAELAEKQYPKRFGWMLRVNREDPDYAAVIRKVAQSRGGHAIRIIPGMNPMDRAAFEKGEYDHILEEAQRQEMPVCIYLPDAPEQLKDVAKKFPELKMVVDHCGLYNNQMRMGLVGGAAFTQEQQMDMFHRVLELGKYPNVALKWAHYSTMFDTPAFPGDGLWPMLREAIDAFGSGRIIWASDYSVNQSGDTWGDLLYSMKYNTDLTKEESEAILGGNARAWFCWQ